MNKIVASFVVLIASFQITQAQETKVNVMESILKTISGEPEWSEINKGLVARYGQQTGDSITQSTKTEYYWRKKEYPRYVKEYIEFVKTNNLVSTAVGKNDAAWRVFDYGTSPEDLKQAEKWAADANYEQPANPNFHDTYANILYKSGKRSIALQGQAWAVWISNLNPMMMANLFKMRANLPTWKYPDAPQKSIDEKNQELLWSSIRKEFTRKVDSVVWQTQLRVSWSDKNWKVYTHTLIRYTEEFKPIRGASQLNSDAWTIFLHSDDNAELKMALAWSETSLKDEKTSALHYAFMDTYANLLFKSGKLKEAIEWSEKALSHCPASDKPAYEATLVKIKNGEKTWGN